LEAGQPATHFYWNQLVLGTKQLPNHQPYGPVTLKWCLSNETGHFAKSYSTYSRSKVNQGCFVDLGHQPDDLGNGYLKKNYESSFFIVT